MELNLSKNTCTQQEIEANLREYFGQSLTKLNLFMSGRIAMIDIEYTDFKPVREAQRYIIDSFSNVLLGNVTRTLSTETVNRIMIDMEDCPIYIKEDNGEMRETNPGMLVDEAVFNEEIA